MEYAIVLVVVISMLTVYHYFRYRKSGYQKFEYYLSGETDGWLGDMIIFWVVIVCIALFVGFVLVAGMLVKYLFL